MTSQSWAKRLFRCAKLRIMYCIISRSLTKCTFDHNQEFLVALSAGSGGYRKMWLGVGSLRLCRLPANSAWSFGRTLLRPKLMWGAR